MGFDDPPKEQHNAYVVSGAEPAPPFNGRSATGRSWLLWALLLSCVFGTGVALRSAHMTDTQWRTPDERIYTTRARRLMDEGIGVYREFYREFNANPGDWAYPGPGRIAHEVVFALIMKATGVRDGRAGAAASWGSSVLSMLLLAWIGVRFFNRWIALLATGFLSFSYADLANARRAWQDATFGFFSLCLVYVACELMRRPRSIFLHVVFAATQAVCFLTKETAVLSCGVCVAWLAVIMVVEQRSWKLAGWLASGSLAAGASSLIVMSAAAGGAEVALTAIGHTLHTGTGPYGAQYQSGSWYLFPWFLWLIGPFTAGMVVAGIISVSLPRRFSLGAVTGISELRCAGLATLLTMTFVAFATFGPNTMALRFLSPAIASYCLLAAVGLWSLLSVARASLSGAAFRLVGVLVILLSLAAATHDYRAFTRVVVRSGLGEPNLSQFRTLMQQ